jgi:hypothetical protein
VELPARSALALVRIRTASGTELHFYNTGVLSLAISLEATLKQFACRKFSLR